MYWWVKIGHNWKELTNKISTYSDSLTSRPYCKTKNQKIDRGWLSFRALCNVTFLIGWYEFPTTSKTLVYPIKEAEFPTVTFCTKNNNPDRWGAAIKILDHLDLKCENERYYKTIGLSVKQYQKKFHRTFENLFLLGLINLSSKISWNS